jgi:hypothetical protein
MAKEKSGNSPVVLRSSVVQGAANGFIQGALLTGLSQAGNDALVVKEIRIEFPTLAPAAVGAYELEGVLTRATKAAMANILDDDVVFKQKQSSYYGAAGVLPELGLVTYVPVTELVLIEDTVYFGFKSLNCAAVGTAIISIIAQPANVTESEKVGILLTRLN